MLEPGDTLQHYTVEATVGGGGAATVYRVRHAILRHVMALKVLSAELVQRDDLRRRFLAEGRVQAAVRHPGIVPVTDVLVDGPRHIAGLVMEYVEGPDLGELIARRTDVPELSDVLDLIVPVLEALHHAHQEGIVHCDVKPSNILVSKDATGAWHPRLSDFGIAHVADLSIERSPGLGTPGFMGPEQIEGTDPTPAWDVFAIGCVLFELVTGQPAFDGETVAAINDAVLAGERTTPSSPLPERLALAIEGALGPAASRPTCAELLHHLVEGRKGPEPVVEIPDQWTEVDSLPRTWLSTSSVGHRNRQWIVESGDSWIGSGAVDVDMVVEGAQIDPRHARLVFTPQGWVLHDASVSGTRVNGAVVETTRLEDGDLLRIGHQVLKFHTEARPSAVPVDDNTQPARGPRLDILAPKSAIGTHLIPDTGLLVGNGADTQLRLDEPLAADHHCRLMVQGLDVVVEDLGSTNGTTVDGQRVRFRRLREGAVIGIGDVRLRYTAR